MVKTKELKPPADLVEAIQNSEDGSTAPPEAEATGGIGATRAIGNKLTHETQQKPSELQGDELREKGSAPDQYEKQELLREQQKEQLKEAKYDRNHPGAGKAGRGDEAIQGMAGVDRFSRGK
jgi:hypothetical protein